MSDQKGKGAALKADAISLATATIKTDELLGIVTSCKISNKAWIQGTLANDFIMISVCSTLI